MRQKTIALQATLRVAGWYVSAVHWANEADRIVEFAAKPPEGKSILVTCHEMELIENLKRLANSPPDSSADMTIAQQNVARVTAIQNGNRPIVFIQATSREEAIKTGVSAVDAGFGVAVLVQSPPGKLVVMVVGAHGREVELMALAARYRAAIAAERSCKFERVHVMVGCESIQ